MTNPLDKSFRDWEGSVFGFGYGTGEEHTTTALKLFMDTITDRSYDYRVLEEVLTPPVAWLLINALCHDNLLSYGVSPRFGWLEPEGVVLKAYIYARSVEELLSVLATTSEDDCPCYKDACNCGPTGYEKGRVCVNPFWARHHD